MFLGDDFVAKRIIVCLKMRSCGSTIDSHCEIESTVKFLLMKLKYLI